MSRLDDELERQANISEQQIAARVHAARISGTGPHYCIDCDNTIPQARVKRSEAAVNAAPSARPSTNFKPLATTAAANDRRARCQNPFHPVQQPAP